MDSLQGGDSKHLLDTSSKKDHSLTEGKLSTSTVYVPIIRLQQNHPLFIKLSTETIKFLLQIGHIITLIPNQILYREDSKYISC